ncbi:FAD-dependent oxidoreductase [Acidovorax sp. NCPPB 2350]|nr:FAD-dependent oxidoreductase [Acidovorax sp. NCPPB 2350]
MTNRTLPLAPPPHRVLIVGGGVAGLEIASALGRRYGAERSGTGRPAATVTLLDRGFAHVWKPMLHTIAAGTRDISLHQTTYIAQARDAGFAYEPGALHGLDRASQTVLVGPLVEPDGRLLIPERRLRYDTLVMALGSQAHAFGTPGVAEHCWTIDSREEASAFNHELRIRLLQCLARDTELRIAIVGGGATGVEMAAELVQLAEAAAAYGAQGMRERIHITLIDSGRRLLQAFPEDISHATRQRLEALGITVLSESRVNLAHAHGVTLADGRQVPAALTIWAAGVKGPDVLAGLDGLETTPSQQLRVLPSLQTTADETIYAVGDCASLTPQGAGRPLPPTAQVAHQQAQHLIRHLPRTIAQGREVPAFAYRDFGSMVSLGDYDAYASLGKFGLLEGLSLRGRLAQVSHALLYRDHQARLHGRFRGSLLWLAEWLSTRVRGTLRLD